ncbi:MAG: AI-2E family transporter [Planctomycetes bacterium]|nr:AI-2E family transporter [Planctomycetota bacterium]
MKPAPTTEGKALLVRSGALVRATAALVLPAALAWTLSYLGGILLPLFSAVFLLFVLAPAALALQRVGLGELLSYFVALVIGTALVLSMGLLLYSGFAHFEIRVPFYVERFEAIAARLVKGTEWEKPGGGVDWGNAHVEELLRNSPAQILRWSFGSLLGFLSGFGTAIFFLVFLVLEQHSFPGRLKRAFPQGLLLDGREIALRVGEGVRVYVRVKTLVSLGAGVTTGLSLWALGVDFWMVWALLAFAFNYVPYVGSLIASVPPVLIAFLQFDLDWRAWAVLALVLVNQLGWGSLIEPRVTGKRLDLSPLLIVIGLAYLGLVWGVMGMVISVPLLLATRELLICFPSTRPLGMLMSTGERPDPELPSSRRP